MKKKFLLCVLALSLISTPICVNAEPTCDEPEFLGNGYVRIKGTADKADEQLGFRVARAADTYYVAIKEVVSGPNKSFEIKFRIPDTIGLGSSNGTYKCWITGKTSPVEFEYISFDYLYAQIKAAASKTDLFNVINGCTADDIKALGVMGIDTARMATKKSEGKLQSITDKWFDGCDFDAVDGKTAAGEFNKLMGLVFAADGDAATALELINPKYNTVEFKDATNKSDLATVMSNNMNSTSLAEFDKAYTLSNKIIEFRSLSAAKMVEAIGTYDAYFGFSGSEKYSKYSNMILTQKGQVGDEMFKLVNSKTNKKKEIFDAFETAVGKVPSGGGSGGGGGGGGAGGGSTGIYSDGETKNEYQVGTVPTTKPVFSDLTGSEWATEAITALYNKGIVSGGGDGKFNPEDSVTREEFTKMIILMCGLYDENAECDFKDADKGEWYYKYIASAVKSGIINGIGEGSFGTGHKITREDMAVIVSRAAEMANVSLVPQKNPTGFIDKHMISDYAGESIEKLYRAGIINGVGGGAFAPKADCTRAQAAKIIYEAFIN